MDEHEKSRGGGSGGDTGMTDPGNQVKSAKATYQIGGNQVLLVSRKREVEPGSDDPAPGPSKIALLAAGSLAGGFVDDGTVDIRGCKAVRITSGPLAIPMVSPGTSSASTDGVGILVGQTQKVSIQRGITPLVSQYIELDQNSIVINAGTSGSLILRAGQSQITIDSSGITIVGMPLVQINPGPPPPPPPPPPIDDSIPGAPRR